MRLRPLMFRHYSLWFWVWLPLCILSCGESDDAPAVVNVQIDPDARLLRDDLINPEATDSLSYALSARATRLDRLRRSSFVNRNALAGNIRADVSLSQSVNVTAEEVSLILDLVNRSLTGTATITLSALSQELSNVMFSLSAKDVGSAKVNSLDGTFSYTNEVLTITPASPIAAGTPLTVEIAWSDADVSRTVDYSPEGGTNFTSDLLDENSSFFTMSYQFWPKLVGQEIMNNMTFHVTYPATKKLVMSGVKLNSESVGNDQLQDTWLINFPLDGDIGLALADYETVTSQCGNTIIEVYAVPGTSIDGFPINPSIYAPVLSSYCDRYRTWFGEPAFGIIRFVGVDERFTSGVATPGLVIVPNYTWDDDGNGSFSQRDFYLAHEFAHQWWGNNVFVSSPADRWLIEGMADFVAANAVDGIRGHADGQGTWLWEVQPLLSFYKNGGRDQPLVPIDSSSMEPYIYYIKGAWVLRMLESVIGTETLMNSLQQFRDAHSFAAASTAEFTSLITQTSGQNMEWFFGEWLYGLGLLSLSEKQVQKSGSIEVTITQSKPWAQDPDRYFVMPISVRIENDGRSIDEILQLNGIESTALFALP